MRWGPHDRFTREQIALSTFPISLNLVLEAASVALIVPYAVLFSRLSSRYPADRALLAGDRRGRQLNFIVLMPAIIAIGILPMPYKAAALALGLTLVVALMWAQRMRLRQAGASAFYLRRQAVIAPLALLGAALFGISLCLAP